MLNNNSNKIDFDEPIPEMIERLKREHRNFESKLNETEDSINRSNDLVGGIKIIRKENLCTRS